MKKKYFQLYSKKENYKKLIIFFKINLSIYIIFLIFETNNLFKEGINLVNFINNKDFQFMKEISRDNFNLILSKKTSKIEIIFILIQAIPFINKKIIIEKKKNLKLFGILNDVFKFKKRKKNYKLYIDKTDYDYFANNFNKLIYYKWEFFPNKILINNLRYIINNYYNENCLEIFDKALNLNFKVYIQKNKRNFSFKVIYNLMSKYFFIYFYQAILECIKKRSA